MPAIGTRCLAAGFAAAVAAAAVAAQPSLRSGLDLQSLDRTVRPQDDLYRFANGGWLDRTEIPADRVTYGTFVELAERTELDLRRIIEGLEGRSPLERQIRAFYASVMDEQTLEARGASPLQPELQRIEDAATPKALAEQMGRLSAMAAGGPFSASAGLDVRDPTRIIVEVSQGGTLLPDREYYFKADAQSLALRNAYLDYLALIFRLTGRPNAETDARAVLALETALARAQQPHAESRVTLSDDAAFRLKELQDRMPGFDWMAWAKPQGIDRAAAIVLGQPAFFKAFAELTQTAPLPAWKAWLAARYITASAPYVNKSLSDARFEFFGRVLTGQQTPRARWKQGVSLVSVYMGDALGRLYAEKHFPEPSRKRVRTLVDNILEAYRQAVRECAWMSPRTRDHALDKLRNLQTRVGYPDRWRNFTGLELRADDLLGNAQRAQKFDTDYKMMRLLRRREPDQWLITPQTVNANYLPWRNEMVLPAAILQPPLFDPAADDAVNYGGIGAVIGHEISHAFDQLGRRWDGFGAARDWWSKTDQEEFDQRARALVEQFNRYTALPGLHVNGTATLGENVGDLGGLAVAVRAYRLSVRNGPAAVIDGFTGEQRLFIRWAQLWRTQTREAYLRQTLLINQHAPAQYRANGSVVNLDAFHEAFGVQPGDKLFLDPKKRIRIW